MTSPVLWPTSAPAAAIPNDVPLFVGDFRHQRQQQQQQSVSSSSADNDSTSLFAPQFDFDADNWRLLQELLELEREIIRNYTQRGDEDASDPLTRPAVRAAVVVVFVAVIAVGVAANSVVLCVVIASRRLKTVTNVFIGNLAVSDLWLCILSLPVQLHYQMTEKWIFGPALCRIVFPAFAVPLYSSILSILWIAVDRYRLIVCPLRRRWSTRAALGMIAAGVLVSVIIAIPVICYTNLESFNDERIGLHKSYCVEHWPSRSGRRLYSVVVFGVQFCLPLAVSAILYERIYASLRRRRSARLHGTSITHRCPRRHHRHQQPAAPAGPHADDCVTGCFGAWRPTSSVRSTGAGSSACRRWARGRSRSVSETAEPDLATAAAAFNGCQPSKDAVSSTRLGPAGAASAVVFAVSTSTARRRRRGGGRTSRLLFAIVANFVAFWLPWNVFSLVVEFDSKLVRGSLFRIVDLGLKVFALAGSACVNPFIYCWFNDNFRVELAALVASVPLSAIRARLRPPTSGGRRVPPATADRRSGPKADGLGGPDATAIPPTAGGDPAAAAAPVRRSSRRGSGDGASIAGGVVDDWRQRCCDESSPDDDVDIPARSRKRRRIYHQRSTSCRTTTTSASVRPRRISRSVSVAEAAHQIAVAVL